MYWYLHHISKDLLICDSSLSELITGARPMATAAALCNSNTKPRRGRVLHWHVNLVKHSQNIIFEGIKQSYSNVSQKKVIRVLNETLVPRLSQSGGGL
jgi:hypothetical protein